MASSQPNIIQMLRAPFFSSILSPLLVGTFLAASICQSFNFIGFILVLIMGIGLHSATNVYNDIYDTKQGTDKINIHRNEFSGGSGLIVQYPQILPKMYHLARIGLVLAFIATVGLTFIVNKNLWGYLWILYFLSAFFSKYYTAAPVKLASRGFGEISVWLAFGPMAILVASVSQNLGFHAGVLLAMPITGISTLSILLVGQMIDYPADKESGKWGVAARQGTRTTTILYLMVQFVLMINVIVLSLYLQTIGLILLVSLIPYLILLPKIFRQLNRWHADPGKLKPAAGMNVQLHLGFSGLLSIAMVIYFVIM